jgi:hypothetical protein
MLLEDTQFIFIEGINGIAAVRYRLFSFWFDGSQCITLNMIICSLCIYLNDLLQRKYVQHVQDTKNCSLNQFQ